MEPFTRAEAIENFERAQRLRRLGRLREACDLLKELYERCGGELDVRVPVLNEWGLAAKQAGDFDTALTAIGEVVRLFDERLVEGLSTHAAAIDNLGFVERERGNLAKARAHHERAAAMLREEEDSSAGLAHSLTNLAVVLKDLGLLHRAQTTIDEALALTPDHEPAQLGYVHMVRGLIFQLLREWDSARRAYLLAIVCHRAASDGENMAVTLNNLATVEYERGRVAVMMRLLRRSLSINQRLKITAGLANDYRRLALYGADAGALAAARTLMLLARRAARRAGDRVTAIWCELDVARIALAAGDTREAMRRSAAARRDAETLGEPFLMHEVLLARGTALRRRGRKSAAICELERAAAMLELLRDGAGTEELALRFFADMTDACTQLVELLLERNDVAAAFSWAERARGRELHRRLRWSRSLHPRSAPRKAMEREQRLLDQLAESGMAGERREPIERELLDLWSSIAAADPEYVALRRGDIATCHDVRRDLVLWSAELRS